MSTYFIGDLQGCCDAFERLLQTLDFSPSRDELYVLGDLINRGPHSWRTLQRLQELGHSAHALLGNHDLHFLAVAQGLHKTKRGDTVAELLEPENRRREVVEWLRHQPLALQAQGWLLVHAGVPPQWSAAQTLALAAEVQQVLQSSLPEMTAFLKQMYGSQPDRWHEQLEGADRLRFIVNALTRMRFCTPDGQLDFQHKGAPQTVPAGLMPWFEVPKRRTANTPIAFGHWSTLGLIATPHLLALDTGCLWGRQLSAAKIQALSLGQTPEIIQVPCPQAAALDC